MFILWIIGLHCALLVKHNPAARSKDILDKHKAERMLRRAVKLVRGTGTRASCVYKL